MKNAFNKLAGKGPKGGQGGRDPEQEAARQLEAARREAAERLGGSRVDPAAAAPSPAVSRPPSQAPSRPAAPPQPAPPASGGFLGGAPPTPPGPSSFGGPPEIGGGATPAEERRAITDMALEDLQRQRQSAPAENPAVVRPPRMPDDEYERRRPPAPGESLPGVPPPHIPSEDLRDQALREILERKERLDREYREREGGRAAGGPRPKTRLDGRLAKAQDPEAQETAARETAARQPEPSRPAAREATSRPQPAVSRRGSVPEPEAKAAAQPASTTTTGESIEEALAGIRGVGPVVRNALLERFDSVEAIREADAEDLTEVDGIGPALASRIKTSL